MAAMEVTAKPTRLRKTINALGGIFGAAVGMYSGINLLIPLGATAGIWWVGKKLLRPDGLLFLPAVAVQTGHLLWFSLGLILLGGLDANLLDVIVLVVGLIWLVAKPGLSPIILLTVFQLFALSVNGFAFADAAVGTPMHKALLVHIIWRVLALSLMWHAYLKFRKGAQIATVPAGS